MLNWIWLSLILVSILYAGWTGRAAEVQAELFESAKGAVELVIGLVGLMVFMLGIMRVAFDGGLRNAIGRLIAPLTRRLFPDVPPDHPAMGAMVMNMASNILGLGNAATPFGLKAMAELRRLNPHPGVASDPMVLFLAINTSAITLVPPLGTAGVRLAAGSSAPMAIWIPTVIATTCSTVAAVGAYYALRRLPWFRPRPLAELESPEADELEVVAPAAGGAPTPALSRPHAALATLVVVGLLLLVVRDGLRLTSELTPVDALAQLLQTWAFLLLIALLLLYGFAHRVPVYESAVSGAREGLEVAVHIVPYLVAILTAVAMLRASGALDELVIPVLTPFAQLIGAPAEALPMAILRPLSGSGAFGVMAEILETYGPDSSIGLLTSTLQGSTETTFYVLALYLGAARVRDGRHALLACLCGDVAGFFGAVFACRWFFG